MKPSVTIQIPGEGGTSYPIYIEESFDSFAEAIGQTSSVFLISQKGLESIVEKFTSTLGARLVPKKTIYLEQGEENKHTKSLLSVYNTLIESGVNRSSTIVALGGGVVGDFAGFVAATILRGIQFVQVPTSLLAAVDSSVGGKVAVNVDSGKNMVGAFYQPGLVYCNVSVFETLPEPEWACGFAEIVKHCFMDSSERPLQFLEENADRIRRPDIIKRVIEDSVKFKASIVSQDPKEAGLRSILNLGHTTAHALESLTSYKEFSHGQAVSRGLVTAVLISKSQGMSAIDSERIFSIMKKLNLPMDTRGFSAEKVFEQTKFDKKNTSDGIRFVLLKKLGEPVYGIPVSFDQFAAAWKEQGNRFG